MESIGKPHAQDGHPLASRSSDGDFGRILKQSSLYALGNIAVKASGLLLAPLYLNSAYLSPEAFGYFVLLIVTAQLEIFIGYGLGVGLLKFITDPAYEHHRSSLPFTTLILSTATCSLLFLVTWLSARPLAQLILDNPNRYRLLVWAAIYASMKITADIPLVLLRANERSGLYCFAVISESVLLIGSVYYFLAIRRLGLDGLMIAYLVSSGIVTLGLLLLMLQEVAWKFDRHLLPHLVRFSWPLLLGGLAAWFLNFGDRYLLKWFIDPQTTALYEWAARLAGVLNMLFVQSFQLVFSVIGFKSIVSSGSTGSSHLHRDTFRHYVIWTGWATLSLALLSSDVTRLLSANPFYLLADPLVLFLGLGFMAYGIYYIIVNVLYAAGHTYTITILMFAAAIFNLVLNILLIPVVGVLGAAVTTYLSYLSLSIGTTYFANRNQHVQFPWRIYALIVCLVAGLYLLGRPATNWGTASRLVARTLLILAYLPILVVVKIYSTQQLRQYWLYIRNLIPGRTFRS